MSNPFDQFSGDVQAPSGASVYSAASELQKPAMNGQPYGAPPPQPGYGAPPPPAGVNPFGAGPPPQHPPPQPPADASNPFGAPPSQYGQPLALPPPAMHGAPDSGNPFGAPPNGAPPPPPAGFGAPPSSDPWGAPPQNLPVDPYGHGGAIVPAQPAVDPFAVFNTAPAPPPPAPVAPPAGPAGPPVSGDVFGDMGFGPPVAVAPSGPGPAVTNSGGLFDQPVALTETGQQREAELPPGGEWYDARIFTPTLGVMFFKPQELTDSLFLNTDRELVDALDERPVVAFIVEGSSARAAGVELGHVLLKVNGVDVKNPKDASRLIKEGPRPLPLLFYVPSTEVVTAEGEHMVKYDTRDTTAPNSAKDWKPKYVVIGGIIAQPWMMNMYRSKSEYDIAVIETQARRPVSVKVKQFSLQGARIQNDWQGPQMVKYKNKLHPWKYIVVLPVARNPIKISSPNLTQLKPVHEGIRRVLLGQQRDRGSNPNAAGPIGGSDPYANGSGRQNSYSSSSQRDSYSSGPPPSKQDSYRSAAPAPPPPPQQDLLGFDEPSQPSYGAAPPQQQQQPPYGAPPPQYGAPPPQYGAPPPQYGAHPPQYGAPPPQYGAPTPQYGAPTPQPNYGAPPPQAYGQPPAQPAYTNYQF